MLVAAQLRYTVLYMNCLSAKCKSPNKDPKFYEKGALNHPLNPALSQLWVDQSGERIVKAHVWVAWAFTVSSACFFLGHYFVCFKMEWPPLKM